MVTMVDGGLNIDKIKIYTLLLFSYNLAHLLCNLFSYLILRIQGIKT